MESTPQTLNEMSIDILGLVLTSMANFNAPMLLDQKHWVQASELADRGLLQRNNPIFETYGYTLTQAGIEAYNAAVPVSEEKPLIKIWGDSVPASIEDKMAFIKSQAKPLSQAKFLEYTTGTGRDADTISFTLSEDALDAKLKKLGFKGWDDEDSCERFNTGDEDSRCFYICEDTFELLDGNWSDDPNDLIYFMSGFAWRRENGFQMERNDWNEVAGYLYRLDHKEAAELVAVLCESCFLEPRSHNDTGLYNPGGPCLATMEDLVELFDFMKEKPAEISRPPC